MELDEAPAMARQEGEKAGADRQFLFLAPMDPLTLSVPEEVGAGGAFVLNIRFDPVFVVVRQGGKVDRHSFVTHFRVFLFSRATKKPHRQARLVRALLERC